MMIMAMTDPGAEKHLHEIIALSTKLLVRRLMSQHIHI